MFEIKENQRVLPDGTEITTYSRDIVSANILEVEAGTTGYKGGDSGHGGRTYFRIADAASTTFRCTRSVAMQTKALRYFLVATVNWKP